MAVKSKKTTVAKGPRAKETGAEKTRTETPRNDVYELLVPKQYCGETVTQLPLRRLTGKDQIAVEREMYDRLGAAVANKAGEQERSMYMLARATGMPVEFVEMMDLADFRAMQQQWGINFFLQP